MQLEAESGVYQNNVLPSLALLKPSTHSYRRQWEYKYTHTAPPFRFTCVFVPTSFWISLDLCTDDIWLHDNEILLIPVYGNIFNWASLYTVVLQWVFMSQWTL